MLNFGSFINFSSDNSHLLFCLSYSWVSWSWLEFLASGHAKERIKLWLVVIIQTQYSVLITGFHPSLNPLDQIYLYSAFPIAKGNNKSKWIPWANFLMRVGLIYCDSHEVGWRLPKTKRCFFALNCNRISFSSY